MAPVAAALHLAGSLLQFHEFRNSELLTRHVGQISALSHDLWERRCHFPGASFVVNGAAQASDSALVTAAAEVKWLNGWSAAGTFEGEFSNVTRSYAGKGVMRYAW
jgi:hypothetical protein